MNLDWMSEYRGEYGGNDGGRAMAIDDSGNVYVTGNSGISTGFQYVTIKYNKFGDSVWVRTYRRPEPNQTIPFDIALDDSGNVFVTGLPTIKYDRNGNVVWISEYTQINKKMMLDSLGNIIIGGSAYYQIVAAKYNSNGERIWRQVNNVMEQQYFRDITIDKNGNVIVTGSSRSPGTYYDYVTIKYSSNGDLLWKKKYNGIGPQPNPYDEAFAVKSDDEGNVYVTGHSQHPNGGFSCVTIKYDSSGNEIWVKRNYSASGGYAIGIDENKNIFIAGRYGGSSYTFKLDSSGNELWGNYYFSNDGFASNYPKMILDSIYNVYVTANSTASGSTDYAFLKYDSSGNEIYSQVYVYSTIGYEYVSDMALDKNGNVYLTGENRSMITVKFSPIITGITLNSNITDNYKLHQNYPNPFNPTTQIKFDLPKDVLVSIKIFDILGREVKTLVNDFKTAGRYSITFNGAGLSSGVYYYKIKAGDFEQVRKMVMIR